MALIPLTQGKHAIVDDEAAEELSNVKWHVVKFGTALRPLFYAVRNAKIDGKWKLELMHRRITRARKGKVVDHINSDSLDNRSNNLRVCTQRENMKNQRSKPNKTGFRGVSAPCATGYMATIRNGTVKYLGYFKTAEEAGRAYDAAAIKEFGEFAKLNFPIGNVTGHIVTSEKRSNG